MPCPPILTSNEIDEIYSNVESKIEGTDEQRMAEFKKVICIIALKKIIGEPDYIRLMSGKYKKGSFLDYVDVRDRYQNLRFFITMDAINTIHCRPGFREKLLHLIKDFFPAVEFEIRIASHFEKLGWPVTFRMHSGSPIPEFEVEWSGIIVGIECKWKRDMRSKSPNAVVKSIINSSLKGVNKKFKEYTTGFIFIGGYIHPDKIDALLSRFEPEIMKWLSNHPRIQGVYFYPIIEQPIKEKRALVSAARSSIYINENRDFKLDHDFINHMHETKLFGPGFVGEKYQSTMITPEDIDRLLNKS
jgi:hypothetical protein